MWLFCRIIKCTRPYYKVYWFILKYICISRHIWMYICVIYTATNPCYQHHVLHSTTKISKFLLSIYSYILISIYKMQISFYIHKHPWTQIIFAKYDLPNMLSPKYYHVFPVLYWHIKKNSVLHKWHANLSSMVEDILRTVLAYVCTQYEKSKYDIICKRLPINQNLQMNINKVLLTRNTS